MLQCNTNQALPNCIHTHCCKLLDSRVLIMPSNYMLCHVSVQHCVLVQDDGAQAATVVTQHTADWTLLSLLLLCID